MIRKLLRLTFYSLPLIAFLAYRTEPRAEAVSQVGASTTAAPLTAPIDRIQPRRFIFPAEARTAMPGPGSMRLSPFQVKAYVQRQAVRRGVDPQVALWIVKHESSFNPRAKGDGEASRGLWQISRIYHPEVSDAEAFNVVASTEWSLRRIRSGKVSEWSSYRYCRDLYEDCPF
jgi:hypothetical protein